MAGSERLLSWRMGQLEQETQDEAKEVDSLGLIPEHSQNKDLVCSSLVSFSLCLTQSVRQRFRLETFIKREPLQFVSATTYVIFQDRVQKCVGFVLRGYMCKTGLSKWC